jgi:hypothetical protein
LAWKHVRGCLTLRLGLVLLLFELLSLSRGVAAVLRVAVFLLLVSVLLAVGAVIIDARHGDDDANELPATAAVAGGGRSAVAAVGEAAEGCGCECMVCERAQSNA